MIDDTMQVFKFLVLDVLYPGTCTDLNILIFYLCNTTSSHAVPNASDTNSIESFVASHARANIPTDWSAPAKN